MLEAIFPSGVDEITVDGLTQWDKGQTLRIEYADKPTASEVHFAFKGGKEALIQFVSGGVTTIPDVLLQQPYDLVAYVYLVGSDGSGETIKTINLPLERRPMPEDYTNELTPTQAEAFSAMLAEILEVANAANSAANTALAKVNKIFAVYSAEVTFTNGQATYSNAAITSSSVCFVQRRAGVTGYEHNFSVHSNNGSLLISCTGASGTISVNILVINN